MRPRVHTRSPRSGARTASHIATIKLSTRKPVPRWLRKCQECHVHLHAICTFPCIYFFGQKPVSCMPRVRRATPAAEKQGRSQCKRGGGAFNAPIRKGGKQGGSMGRQQQHSAIHCQSWPWGASVCQRVPAQPAWTGEGAVRPATRNRVWARWASDARQMDSESVLLQPACSAQRPCDVPTSR